MMSMSFRTIYLMAMRKVRHIILTIYFVLLSFQAFAIPQRPQPQRLVNDFSGILSNVQEAELESMLVAFDDSTSNQIVVVIVNDLEDDTASSYAYAIGERWGVGNEDFNNGIVLLVKPKTEDSSGLVSIQVGYGLEGAIPDVYCKRIIDNFLLPNFRQGDIYTGVYQACKELMALASGEISQPRDNQKEIDELRQLLIRLFLFFLLMYVLVRILNKKNRDDDDWWHSGGGRWDRHIYIGPIGGSPFGRGSFGGGGFSGGSFGGFGGGHFGGGGASGSW